MKASDLFGVVVRAIGLLIVIYALWEIWGGFENAVENLLPANQGDENQPSSFSFFAFGIPSLVFGLLCFFLADWIVRLAYREAKA